MSLLFKANDIEQQFRELRSREITQGTIVALDLPVENAFLAVNFDGDYLFIIKDQDGTPSPSRRLKLLNVDYVIRLTADIAGTQISGNFTAVTLLTRNSELLPAFATLLSLLLNHELANSESKNLRPVVDSLVEFFTPRFGNIRDRAKGLFGELSVISHSGAEINFINAWHDSTNANKDFSFPDRYLEVKTTEGLQRKHDIGLNQLKSDNSDRPIYIVSVLLEEDPAGKSVISVYEELRDSISDLNAQTKLTLQCLDTIGLDFEEFKELKFSVTGGHKGIWVFPGEVIPTPTIDSDMDNSQAISNVRFTINLDVLDPSKSLHTTL